MSVWHFRAVLDHEDGAWLVYRFTTDSIDDTEPSGEFRLHIESREWAITVEPRVSIELGQGMTSSRLAAMRLVHKIDVALERDGRPPAEVLWVS